MVVTALDGTECSYWKTARRYPFFLLSLLILPTFPFADTRMLSSVMHVLLPFPPVSYSLDWR